MSTLREYCKQRLKVAFDSVRIVSNTLNFILVVDDLGLKVLSNTIKMMELINFGIIIVEKLELKRKRYTKIEAVYLISPQSFDKLLQDFPANERPQYKSVHVLSLSGIGISSMKMLRENLSFVKRVKTLKQLNFSFTLFNFNQAKICSYQPNSFQKSLQPFQEGERFLLKTVEQLSSIVTTMSSFYIVEIYYQKSSTSAIPEKVAFGLKEKLENLFKSYQASAVKGHPVPNYSNSAPLTTFLILDRSYDAVSPLVRDYHYGPLFYDIKNILNHKVLNFGKDKKTLTLTENDQILQKYKNTHISQALKGIPSDLQQFSQGHAAAKFHKGQAEGEELDLNQLTEVMKKMPQYMDIKDRYTLHYQALQQILEAMETRQLKEQGFVEQATISLTNDDGKKIKQKDAFSNLVDLLQKTKSDIEKAKLVLIGLMCLELKPKDQSTLTDFLNKTMFEGIQKNLAKLSGPNVYRLNSKKQSKGNEILDRHQSKIEEIVRELSNQNHGDLKMLRVGAGDKFSKSVGKNNQATLGMKKIKVQNEIKDRPRLVIFMNSALGYNQMRALSELQNVFQIIYVTHNFVTPNQYVELINKLGLHQQQELQL